jgi:TPR repeat protein
MLCREDALDTAALRERLGDTPARAAQAILAAARTGAVDAQALLGQILLDGRGITQDQALALRWFSIAAQAGHLMAMNMLGRCHEHGWGCAPDLAAAARCYRACADQGLDWGLYNLANLLATGRGLARDEALAVACYRRAAELGHAKSMNLYGRYLEQGHVVARNLPAARRWYQRSAEAGDFRGQFSHGGMLISLGRLEEGLGWLEKARAGGHDRFRQSSAQALARSDIPQVRALAALWRGEEPVCIDNAESRRHSVSGAGQRL